MALTSATPVAAAPRALDHDASFASQDSVHSEGDVLALGQHTLLVISMNGLLKASKILNFPANMNIPLPENAPSESLTTFASFVWNVGFVYNKNCSC